MNNLTSTFAQLDAVTAELVPLEARRNELREQAARLVVELIKDGAAPTEVAARSPFSAAHVRTLARIAGLPPGKPGGTRRKTASS